MALKAKDPFTSGCRVLTPFFLKRNRYGFLRLLLLLLGGGLSLSLIFGCSFGGRLSLPPRCAKTPVEATEAIAPIITASKISLTFFIFLTASSTSFFCHEGEAESTHR